MIDKKRLTVFLFQKIPSPMFLGPTPVGIIKCIPFTALSIFIFINIKEDKSGNETNLD